VGNPAGQQIVAAIPRPSPITHDNNSLWQPGSQSFFHDPRAMHVGDVITVNVSVTDSAKMRTPPRAAAPIPKMPTWTNLLGLEKVLPPPWTLQPGQDGLGQFQCRRRDRSNATETISMTLAALVAQVLPNGNLVIDGHQQVRVNNELRDMRLSGIVRREDITQDNTVNLSQIAEARVIYGGRGTVSDVQQPRYGSQLLDIIMPW
jgi:flagellar L-ring protein precursor FlgH